MRQLQYHLKCINGRRSNRSRLLSQLHSALQQWSGRRLKMGALPCRPPQSRLPRASLSRTPGRGFMLTPSCAGSSKNLMRAWSNSKPPQLGRVSPSAKNNRRIGYSRTGRSILVAQFDLSSLLQQAQAMQEKFKQMQEEIAGKTVDAEA